MNRDAALESTLPYFAAYAMLLALLGLTVAVSYVEHPAWNVAAALAIAIVKAGVVMWAFMHLLRSGRLVILTALCAIGWLCLLLGLSASDYLTRTADGEVQVELQNADVPQRPRARARNAER